MPVHYASGDPLLSPAQTLAFGHNARARAELGAFELRLFDRYPAAFAAYRKRAQDGRIRPGMPWVWPDSQPRLAFLVVRETAAGAVRLRYAESAVMMLARDFRLYGVTSLAIAPLADERDWPALKAALDHWLRLTPLSVVVYERYLPGVAGE